VNKTRAINTSRRRQELCGFAFEKKLGGGGKTPNNVSLSKISSRSFVENKWNKLFFAPKKTGAVFFVLKIPELGPRSFV